MRATALALVALVLLASVAATPDPAVGFQGPAQLYGPGFASNGTWVFVLFSSQSTGHVTVDTIHESTAIQYEDVRYALSASPVYNGDGRVDDEPGPGETLEPFSLQADPLGPAGLFVRADNLFAEVGANRALIDSYPSNRCPGSFLERAAWVQDLFRRGQCSGSDDVYASFGGLDSVTSVVLRAVGLHEIEFFNFRVSCEQPVTSSCPHGGGPHQYLNQSFGSVAANVRTLSYNQILLSGGEAWLTGSVYGVVLGGSVLSVNASGGARLPGVDDQTCLRLGCEAGDLPTIRIGEAVALRDLQMGEDPDSLRASVVTGANLVLLDEAVLPWLPAPAAVAGAGLLAGLLIGVKFAVGLLTSRRPAKLLVHPNRRRLYNFIQRAPGATFREVVRETGIPSGTARHHIQVLCQAGLICERAHRSTLRYFENNGQHDDSWNSVVLLREAPLARLHAWLVHRPPAYQKDILLEASSWGWSRSTTQHRLSRLVDGGLVTIAAQGRLKRYQAHAAAPLPSGRTSAVGDDASSVAAI